MWKKSAEEQRKYEWFLEVVTAAQGSDAPELEAYRYPPAEYVREGSIEAQARWWWERWKASTDTYYLATEVLRLFETKIGRRRLDPKMHRVMCQEFDREEDTLQLYPRDHLKSSFAKVYAARRVIQRPNIRVAYFSKTANRSYTALAKIKLFFTNTALLMLFPEFDIPRREWLKDAREKFTIFRDESDYVGDEASIEAWGVDSTFTGSHYDVHIYDDIINEDSVRTVNSMEKVVEFWSLMQPIKDPEAVDKVIGTTYHHNDIYQKIIREKWYAIENTIVKKAESGGKFLYRFFNMKLLKKKTRGMRAYDVSCQYYNDPLPEEDQFFVRPYPIYREEHAPKNRVYYIAIDPALSKHSYSDSTGICIGFVDAQARNRLYIERAFRCRDQSEKLADRIIHLITTYNPRRTGIETGLQEHLLPLIQVKIREFEQIQRIPVVTKWVPISIGRTPKPDKINRTTGSFCRDGRMLLKVDEFGNYHPDVMDLVNQMEVYNPNFESNEDDVLDSSSMLIQTVEDFAPSRWLNVDSEMILEQDLEQFIRDRGYANLHAGVDEKWGWQFAG